jgi:hypothetical protein
MEGRTVEIGFVKVLCISKCLPFSLCTQSEPESSRRICASWPKASIAFPGSLARSTCSEAEKLSHRAAELDIADRVGGAPVPLPEHYTEGALAGGVIRTGLTSLLPLLLLTKNGARREIVEAMFSKLLAAKKIELVPIGYTLTSLAFSRENPVRRTGCLGGFTRCMIFCERLPSLKRF